MASSSKSITDTINNRRGYARGIVGRAIELLVFAPGRLSRRLTKALSVVHPLTGVKLTGDGEKLRKSLLVWYGKVADKGDGDLSRGMLRLHHSYRRQVTENLLALYRELPWR